MHKMKAQRHAILNGQRVVAGPRIIHNGKKYREVNGTPVEECKLRMVDKRTLAEERYNVR